MKLNFVSWGRCSWVFMQIIGQREEHPAKTKNSGLMMILIKYVFEERILMDILCKRDKFI